VRGVPHEKLNWVLAFLRYDLAAMPHGGLLQLRNDVFQYLHAEQLATVTDFDPDEFLALGPVPPRRQDVTSEQVIAAARGLLANLQDRLRKGVELLQTGVWQPFPRDQPAPHWSLEPDVTAGIRRAYMGKWFTITLATAADVLVGGWAHLRRCEHNRCRAWFLPRHGRQRYHESRCSQEARYQRFKPTRDYKEEYARRFDSTRQPRRHRTKRA
jgi:hypothetical protein